MSDRAVWVFCLVKPFSSSGRQRLTSSFKLLTSMIR
jgi:hypothetical protein